MCLKVKEEERILASGLEKIMIFLKKSKKSDFFLFKSDFLNLNQIFFI